MGGYSQAFDAGQRAVLERIAGGDDLSDVLSDIVRLIERQAAGMLCSILLYDEAHRCVRHGAAPSLPPAYARLLDGLPVGPCEGSCGAAIYKAERVVVNDIAAHPNWAKYRDLALPHGLRACWSSPIFSPGREVLGTFAMYYLEARGPTDGEAAWVDAATHLAAVAILRERSETALKQSEERLRAVIEHTPDVAIQWYDEGGRIIYCNRASERLFGWASGQALGKTLVELGFFTPSEEERFAAARAVAASGRHVEPIEFCYRRPDGSDGFLLSTVFRIPSPKIESCYVCMDIDLTDRRRMEDAVRSSETLRALIYSSVEDVIFYLAIEKEERYRFLSVNPAFLKATGLAADAVVGRYVHEVVPEPSRSLVLAKYREAVRTQQKVTWEEVTAYPAGMRHGEVTVCPIVDASGRVNNLVGTVHDITGRRQAEEERRRLESELRQSQRLQALGTLAGGIAHDFNNILTAVRANAELALMELSEDHPARESIAEIDQAGRRATELVRQILTFGRHHEPRREVLDLRQLVTEALRLLRVSIQPNVDVRMRFADDTPSVSADPIQIHQVIMNLGTNAVHALGTRRGSIEICLDSYLQEKVDGPSPDLSEGHYARISVIDDGCGMDEATLKRAFDPFFTTKPTGEGTGLGLSVVHGIMKTHGGAITVKSELGKGTAFHLYLPAAQAVRSVGERSQPARGRRVLFVDDEEALVFLAIRVLGRLGYRVTGHTESTNALQEFRARPADFDIVVADTWMPGLSGTALARELLAIRRDILIVMLSGSFRDDDVQEIERLGIRHLLPKPQSVEDLARMLVPLLNEHPSSSEKAVTP